MKRLRVFGVSFLSIYLILLLLLCRSIAEPALESTESQAKCHDEEIKTATCNAPPIISLPETATKDSSRDSSDTTEQLPKTAIPLTCPRVTLISIIEQLQRSQDTSKCVLTNTVLQETLELPQINYASRDCLAKVVSANEEAVKTSAILDDKDNDLYMRNPCDKAPEKFLIIRLCDRIKPTLFEIANMEFFSSAPKDIRVSVSRTYPTSEWILLGEYEMENRRTIQRFLIPDDFDHYVKFLKLELLSHYGKEYYCTLSFVRVYGVPAKVTENDDSNLSSVTSTASPTDSAVQRRFNGSAPGDLATSANTAAIFIEFGKRLTTLEANFKHYGQVIQSIRLLRNETRYLNQENSALRRHLYALQRDRDTQRRLINRIKVDNRRLRQDLKELHEFLAAAGLQNSTNLLPTEVEKDQDSNESESLP